MSANTISVITPVYFPNLDELEVCLASVASNGSVEHVLVLDGEKSCRDIEMLKDLVKKYGGKLYINDKNLGISAAMNRGALEARNSFLMFVDQDDFLTENWLSYWPSNSEDFDLIYSDRTVADPQGDLLPSESFRKPDWSPIRLLGNMYLSHFFAVERVLFKEVGGFRSEFDGSQDHDLALRISARNPRVHHIKEVLYVWRQSATSTSLNPLAKQYAIDAGENAVNDYLQNAGLCAQARRMLNYPGFIEIIPEARKAPISIIIPTAFGSKSAEDPIIFQCLDALNKHLIDGDEVVIVTDLRFPKSLFEEVQNILNCKLRVVIDNGEFNFSTRVNMGAINAINDPILFMNDDVALVSEKILDKAAFYAELPNVGAVGLKLKFPDGRIQHVGHSYHLLAAHHPYYLEENETQNFGDNILDREVSGVTAAFLLQKKSTWEEVGGFTSKLPNNYNDVDFCLKIRNAGFSIVSINSVHAIHHESVTRDSTLNNIELEFIRNRWSHDIWKDKFTRIGEWHNF